MLPSSGLSFFTSTAGFVASPAVDTSLTTASVPLVWLSFCAGGERVISEVSTFFSGTSVLGVRAAGDTFSAPSPQLTLDTGSGRSWQTLISSVSFTGSVAASVAGSSSESEPDAELLSEAERD